MASIHVTHNPDPQILKSRGVFNWPIWTKEISEFPWHYSEQETCYLLEGDVIVTPDNGDAVYFREGDLVVFPAGLICHWKIIKAVKKHYNFG
ncbi:cupin domain-containing protein [bacterium]|nr:cupin domain-containing protein [bacterium]MBU1872929.1 cupin domain-containing protein [bacterium]